MGDWLLAHEGPLRLGVFLGLFALLAALQAWRPLRGVRAPWRRFGRHLLLALLGSALVRLVFPLLAVAVGAAADARDTGLLQWLALPAWAQVLAGVVLLDLAIYWQHRVFHRVPLLWRLHRMHHSDTEFEVSTAIRFHPLEIALSMLIKIGVVGVLGVPAAGVLLFEILLNATALFSHADLRLPAAPERLLRSLDAHAHMSVDGAASEASAWVVFDGIPERHIALELVEAATRADPQTQTYELTFRMTDAAELVVLPGMSATVTVDISRLLRAEPQTWVPASAVTANGTRWRTPNGCRSMATSAPCMRWRWHAALTISGIWANSGWCS